MVDVIVTTYFTKEVPQREEYARQAVKSLYDNLSCDEDQTLHMIIADDSQSVDDGCAAELVNNTQSGWRGSTYTNSHHRGIGASLNTAMKHVPVVNGKWMYTTDDWVLTHPLNLSKPCRLLDKGYDLVRLGPVHPNLRCTTRFEQGVGWWLDLDAHYGGFAFSTRPFVATREFYDKVGPFDELLNSYETERLYAERVAHSTCKLAYWGGVSLDGPWYHVGIECVGYREVV